MLQQAQTLVLSFLVHAMAGPQIANAMAMKPEQCAKRRQVSLDKFFDVSAAPYRCVSRFRDGINNRIEHGGSFERQDRRYIWRRVGGAGLG
jgi:hypothetical protein